MILLENVLCPIKTPYLFCMDYKNINTNLKIGLL